MTSTNLQGVIIVRTYTGCTIGSVEVLLLLGIACCITYSTQSGDIVIMLFETLILTSESEAKHDQATKPHPRYVGYKVQAILAPFQTLPPVHKSQPLLQSTSSLPSPTLAIRAHISIERTNMEFPSH